jgi:16S rRNA (uracil1498-N3)-methyltransferase
MARFFLPPAAWQSTAQLEEDESRHCAQVLRLSAGDEITVFDGCGRSARASIRQVSKHAVSLEMGEVTRTLAPSPAIILAQAVPKGKTIEWIIEKAVELGVSQIIPLVTRHTIVKYDAEEAIKKAEKWQKVALEACKQCGQNWLPQVLPPIDGRTFLESPREGAKIIASLAPGALPLKQLIAESTTATQVTVMIGPEGDFSTEETQLALHAGYRPATLGSLVLRSETAALYAMASLRCQLSC